MKLSHLRNVVAIVERGSLRAAAKHLGLAQPAMSRSIRELEQELGVVLFERNKFGMAPTPAGEVFLRRARSVQADLQRGLDEIAQFKGDDLGKLTVAFSTAGLVVMLPRILRPFRKRFPKVRVKVLESSMPAIEADMRDGLVDMYYGPVPQDFTDSSLVVDQLFDNPRIVVARPGHPLRAATSLHELAHESWVTSHMTMYSDGEVLSIFEAAGLPPPHIAMEAGSGMSLISIVKSSDLLAPLSAQWLDFLDESGVLARLPIRNIANAPPICAVRRAAMPLTPAAEYWNDLAGRCAGRHLDQRTRDDG
ncbi:LysR family transcriptional regulator [Niveispirillum sp.]|uniref:LysR family transcriptional regulator n=1 Tax=Niveispirillum sp. TaxID=1917217 RepID=UPI001B3EBB6F|nr:LysR family transcriptional regulator [Niveispirillum sp.]MBP7335703.1 LysR family transcriptional regulator [Niveispirillum sp.]